ncbi:TSL-kinase interacting protein 1 [Rhynchospora pubera]|uniref:TSL-kinase interacting protein 1 n=1 Tax=Rhynchospora pubera TaxID=906938 RepID=A0AAV8DA92_9POAL|nr:TSL-kinase interacting protein 1 [Rhynchospora pubera]
MKGTKMKGAVDGCKTATDTTVTAKHDKVDIQKPPKFKAPGKATNRCNKKLTAEPSSTPIQCLMESGKFKLQLFPIDSETKNVLEQNDHNPYLELTLATNKKISSVVKHLVEKWRDSFSATALGIMLFPYNARSDNLIGVHKWTLNDTHTTAADVYNMIGTPSVFRLRYGFFSNCESASNEGLPPYLEENFHLKESVPERDLSPFPDLSGEMVSIGQNEPSFDNTGGAHQNVPSKPAPLPSWLDSISNMSFGALLSQTSPYLEGGNPPSQNKNLQVLQATMTCDSFDAAIGALIARQQPTSNHMPPPKAVNQPSIWDGEETCHSFAVQKAAPFARVDHAPHNNALCSKELTDLQTEITAETDNAETKNEMMPLNEESNPLAKLDLSLPEPMVPFENPCSRPPGSSTDSIGFSGLLSTSLDFPNSVF